MGQIEKICLPMQGTRVQSLVQEDPTYHGATKPVHHNYWTLNAQGWCSPARGAPSKSSPCSLQLGKACAQQWRHTAIKINWKQNKEGTKRLKLKGFKKKYTMLTLKESLMDLLSEKVDLRTKNIARNKKDHFIIIKGSINLKCLCP